MVTGTAGTATAFLITLYVAERNYRRSREHIPNLSMDLRVGRVLVSEKYDLVMVTLRATNTGTGLCRVGHVDWAVKALSPYDDEAVEEMSKEYKPETDAPAVEGGTTDHQAIEFPWHEIEQETSSFPISIEPNETEELTQDFIIPAEITAIVASAWVDNVSDPKMTEGWYRRTAHSLKETGHYEPEEVGPTATGPGESQG